MVLSGATAPIGGSGMGIATDFFVNKVNPKAVTERKTKTYLFNGLRCDESLTTMPVFLGLLRATPHPLV